jgi:hypothetical protein
MTLGDALEELKLRRQVPGDAPLVPDHTVSGHGDYQRKLSP